MSAVPAAPAEAAASDVDSRLAFFKNLQNQISDMSPEDMERMKEMIRDLNQMLHHVLHQLAF